MGISQEWLVLFVRKGVFSNAKLMAVGERDMTGRYPERKCRCCMRGGYLYVPTYDKKRIYFLSGGVIPNPTVESWRRVSELPGN